MGAMSSVGCKTCQKRLHFLHLDAKHAKEGFIFFTWMQSTSKKASFSSLGCKARQRRLCSLHSAACHFLFCCACLQDKQEAGAKSISHGRKPSPALLCLLAGQAGGWSQEQPRPRQGQEGQGCQAGGFKCTCLYGFQEPLTKTQSNSKASAKQQRRSCVVCRAVGGPVHGWHQLPKQVGSPSEIQATPSAVSLQ
eukprot:566197-Pelagomonas_calceolata.AAC.3